MIPQVEQLRILWIYKKTSHRNQLKRYLEEHHHLSIVFTDSSALRLLHENRRNYDVILLDELSDSLSNQSSTPKQIVLTNKIKSDFPEIEIIVLTSTKEIGLETLRMGAHRYLTKPLNLEELRIVLQATADYIQIKRIAYQKLRDLEEAKHRVDRLEMLHCINTSINSVSDFEAILKIVLKEGLQVLKTDAGSIMLIDPKTNELEIRVRIWQDKFVTDRPYQTLAVGEGIAGYVAATGQVYNCLDVSEDAYYKRSDDEISFKSMLSAPIILHRQVVGIINANDKEVKFFTENDEQFLLDLSEQIAIAIENMGLFEEIAGERRWWEQAASQSLALHGIAQMLQSELDLSSLLEMIARLTVKLLRTDAVAILLLDNEKKNLSYKKAYRIGKEIKNGTCSLAKNSITGQVQITGDPIIFNNLQNSQIYDSVIDEERYQAVISAPLWEHGEIVGTLEGYRKQEAFEENDLWTISMVATQTAVAIHNAKLFEQTNRRASVLEALYHISLEITKYQEIPQFLDSILERAIALSQAKGGGIFLLSKNNSFRLAHCSENIKEQFGLVITIEDNWVGRTIKAKKALNISNYKNWSFRIEQFDPYNFSVVGAVPIIWQDTTWGVIFIHKIDEGKAFSQEDMNLLSHLGNLVTIALENSDLATKNEDKLHRLEQLAQTSGRIMGDLGGMSLDQRLHMIAKYAAEILNAEACGISLVKNPGVLSLEAGYGYQPDKFEKGREFIILSAPHTGLTGHIAHEGELFNACGEKLLNHFAVKGELAPTPSGNCYSLLAIPLMKKDTEEKELIGLLRVENKKNKYGEVGPEIGFTKEDEAILQLFADAVIVAIEGAKLFQVTKLARERLLSLYKASSVVVSSQNLEEVLLNIVERACAAAGASGVTMLQVNQMAQTQCLATAGIDKEFGVSNVPIRPNGLSMKVLRTGRPEVIEDTRKYRKRVNPCVLQRKIRAALGLPISVEGNKIGVMWLHYDAPKDFSEYELDSIQLYVNQAAMVYNNARHIKELEYMHQAAADLAGANKTSETFVQIVRNARQIFQADSVSVSAYDRVKNKLVLTNSKALGVHAETWRQFCNNDGAWLTRTDAKVIEQKWVGVENIENNQKDGVLDESIIQFLKQIGVRSFQGVVLVVDEEIHGVLYMNYNHSRTFGKRDQRTALTFANHAALALKKVNLLEEVSRSAETAKTVAQITTLENLDITLDLVARGTRYVLNCDAVTIYGYDQNNHRLRYPPIMVGVWYPERASRRSNAPTNHIVFEILKQSQLYIVENTTIDPLFKNRRFALDENIKSCVAIPLMVGNEKVGVMFVNYRREHHFTYDELANVELFAHQASIAIRNAQLYQAEQQRVRELSGLNEISQTISLLTDIQQVYQQINRSIAQLVNTEMCAFLLYDKETGHLVCQLPVYGVADEIAKKYRIPIDKTSPAGLIWNTQNHLILNNVIDNPLVAELDLEQLIEEAGVRDTLFVSLKVGNHNIGVIQASNKLDGTIFSEDDAKLLSIFANQTAAVIENARLYEETERRAQQLNAIYEVSKAASSTLDSSEILRRAVAKMSEIFSLDQGCVILFDLEGDYGYSIVEYKNSQLEDRNACISLKDNAVIEWVITNKQPLVVEKTDNGWLDNFREHVGDLNIRSVMLIPIIVAGRVIGTINLSTTNSEWKFGEREIELAETMSNQLSISVENAQLYEQKDKQIIVLNALYEASRAVINSIDLEKILRSIVEQAWHLTMYPNKKNSFASIGLVEKSNLDFVATYPMGHFRNCISLESINQTDNNESIGIAGRAVKEGETQLVSNVLQDPDYLEIHTETRSELAVPIKIGDDVIGVIDVERPDHDSFSADHQYALESLAAQTAIAIKNIRLFEEAQRRAQLLDTASQVARSTTAILDINKLLTKTVRLISESFDFYHVAVFLLDEDKKSVVLRATYPENDQAFLKPDHELRINSDSIVGFVAQNGEPHLAHNVQKDPYYLRSLPQTRAEMAFPLLTHNRLIGVLDAQSVQEGTWRNEDISTLQTLADQLANAIYGAQQYEELKHTKGLVGARTALAWMGMVSTIWRHAIEGYAITIQDEVELLREDIFQHHLDTLDNRLAKITRMAQLIMDKPITPPLSKEEGVESIDINDLLQERINQLWQGEPYNLVELQLDFRASTSVTVRASSEWLRRIFDLLIDNAITAMANIHNKTMSIMTQATGSNIEIIFTDKGQGIPKDVLPELFNKQIKKPKGSKGLGMGLLTAQTIAQTYGGEIRIESTGPTGTCMLVSLPIESQDI